MRSRTRSRLRPPPWRSDWCGQNGGFASRASRSWCPDRTDLAERLPSVLEAVYGADAIDWPGHGEPVESLSGEALHLATVLTELLPDEPEVLGLAALVCLSEARRLARRTPSGRFVPLDEQDTRALGYEPDRPGGGVAAAGARDRPSRALPTGGSSARPKVRSRRWRRRSSSRRATSSGRRLARWGRRQWSCS
jgi:hypothetical protein